MNDWIPDTPPTLEAFLTPILPPVPVLPVLGLLMAVLYLAGAIRLWRQGRRWSVARTVCFLLGCIVLVAVTGLAVEGYGHLLFSVFMFQQLTLMMAIPPLLVLGSPGTLLLRATPHRGLGRVILRLALAGLRSRIARWALSPWIAMPLFLMSFYGLYLGGLADPILQTPGGHPLLEIAFLAAGVLFTIPILSNDPLPVRMTYPGRAMDLFAEAALHAFFGVFLMMSPTLFVETFAGPTTALGIDPLEDQWLAGALAWSYGEGPTVVMLLYVMHRWFRDDTVRAAKADKYADAHGDPELDAYNAYLDALRKKDT
ncbi:MULTISPECIES: cytochrome c oxidase assembly protein [unclassified Microbacterium]|uniref:cytochrome c oxidase assembly protein n=1 Tax=unclassified Microbacterium TaxID=2609290 RepID=UPI0023067E32|nr:cytochrome c oxidase assembly protein [Microbacterium sp. nov. GSS16]WCD93047.1 cytochrome c oxidase assembly protein [Microbacterium sp. nov. GSS16]